MQLKNSLKLSSAGMAFLLMVGCAKNNVQETFAVANTGMPRPNSVLIYNFAVNPDDVKTTSGILGKLQASMKQTTQSAEETQLAREVSDAMATELTQKIVAMGLNPVRATQTLRPPQGAIMITGAFVNIDEGNTAQRNVIGLGMGQSSLDSQVVVLAPSPSGNQELLSFDAHAEVLADRPKVISRFNFVIFFLCPILLLAQQIQRSWLNIVINGDIIIF